MKTRFNRFSILVLAAVIVLAGCAPTKETSGKFKIDYEKFTLDNGLEVILHEEVVDSIIAVEFNHLLNDIIYTPQPQTRVHPVTEIPFSHTSA